MARWRDLEACGGKSVFQSWTWTGCLMAESFTDPVLVEATEAGRTVAPALFNRLRGGYGQPDLLCLGESGDPTLDCPGSMAEAHDMVARMEVLRQGTWTARGQSGSFATAFFGKFHHALIETGFPLGQVALIEVTRGGRTIGILYNLRDAGGIRAYQSGFAYEPDVARAKPGLTCHHAAIRPALEQGADRYDFLAGDDRYKRSLASSAARQYQLEAGPAWSPRMLRRRLGQARLDQTRLGQPLNGLR
jgi:CelD/BcsL family acetyltransferase involved in cellulose biosynthesis